MTNLKRRLIRAVPLHSRNALDARNVKAANDYAKAEKLIEQMLDGKEIRND